MVKNIVIEMLLVHYIFSNFIAAYGPKTPMARGARSGSYDMLYGLDNGLDNAADPESFAQYPDPYAFYGSL